MDLLPLTLLGGLLALDGTAVGQFMVSRPLVAGVLTGWVVGDPALGLLLGGILEVYVISIFPVGGAEFPEGGPPTLVAVAVASTLPLAPGLALGAILGLLLSRFGAWSIRILRRVNGRLAPDPARGEITPTRLILGHLGSVSLEFFRGSLLSLGGLILGSWIAVLVVESWPLGVRGTITLLSIGAAIPAGALIGSLGGWRRRGVLLGAGVCAALLGSLLL